MKLKHVSVMMLTGALLLSGCSKAPAEESTQASTAVTEAATEAASEGTGSWTNGEYTATVNGYGGEFQVTVVLDDTGISSITVGENNETESIGAKALPMLTELVMDSQSVSVDVVSGATVTSQAFLGGVKDCLTQAGADLSQFEAAAEEAAGEEIAMERSAVVVGGGAAGLTAALRLHELGVEDITVLEQMSFTGGASATCGGGFLASGSKYQKNYGSETAVQDMNDYITEHGSDINDKELTNMHSSNAAATVDWLIDDIGVEFNMPTTDAAVGDFVAVGSGAGLMETLAAKAEEAGIEIMTDTDATELITTGDVVTGVKAVGTNGNTYTIQAEAVILATGGYGNNAELIKEANVGRVIYYGPASSNGDGLLMAKDLGAKVTNMQYLGVKPNGLEITEGVGKYTQPANKVMWKSSAGISVNSEGQRVISETAGEAELVEAYKQQEDWAMYTVMDQAAYDTFYNAAIEKHLFSEADANRWIEEKGTGTTVFVKGEDVLDAAAQAGINGEELVKTIEAYNQGYEAGEDAFGRELVAAFDTEGPVYIVKQNLRFATTLGGLDINEQCQVLKEDDSAIEGLYAAGEVVGNVQGDASTSYLSWAATSGKLAAECVAEALK